MFKAIHGIAPTPLSHRIVMNFDANGYDIRGSDMDLYLPTLYKEADRNSFMSMGDKLWKDLHEFVQNSTNIESFQHNCTMYKRITSSWQNRHLRFLAINQFLYEVIMVSLPPKNSTLYIDVDFCISLRMGWSRILCYTYIYLCHYLTLFVYMYWKLSICFTITYFRMVLQSIVIRLSLCYPYTPSVSRIVFYVDFCDHGYELCCCICCIWQDLI